MLKKGLSVVLSAVMICGGGLSVYADESDYTILFVSTEGSDRNNGSEQQPFETIEKARDTIRDLKKSNSLGKKGAVVYLRKGQYVLKNGVEFTSEDSGTQNAPICYRSYPDEEVTLVGGVVLNGNGFTKLSNQSVSDKIVDESARDKIYQFDLKAVGLTEIPRRAWRGTYSRWTGITDYFIPEEDYPGNTMDMEFYVDGKAMTVAQYPNTGYMKIKKIISQMSSAPTEMRDAYGEAAIQMRNEYLALPEEEKTPFIVQPDTDRAKYWTEAKDALLWGRFYWEWADQSIPITHVDTDTGAITTKYPSVYGALEDRVMYAYNLVEELDMPGEYYIDRDSEILYYYPENSSFVNSEMMLSVFDMPMFKFDNAEYIELKNIEMKVCRSNIINVSDGRNINVRGCEMAFSASDPIKVSGGYEHSIIDCYVHDTEGGADIDAGDRATLENGNCYIENSEFEACDRLTKTYNMAINIGGCGNRATNNKLHDSAHMIFGWGGNNNIIAFNEVFDACNASDDMGALYAGRQIASRGNKILYNYIHDIGKSGALGSNGVHAIYLDDGYSGTDIVGNVFVGISGYGVFVNGGRDNVVYNNIFADCKTAINGTSWCLSNEGRTDWQTIDYKSDIWKEAYPELYNLNIEKMGYPDGNIYQNNLYYNSGINTFSVEMENSSTVENNYSTNADPGFYDINNKNYLLPEGAQVYDKIDGFKFIPFTRMGMYSDRAKNRIKSATILVIGSPYSFVKGEKKLIDSDNRKIIPVIINDLTYLPIRFVAESLGSKVSFTDGIAMVEKDSDVIEIDINNNIVKHNSEAVELCADVIVTEGRTYLPLRAVSELLKKQIFWDDRGFIAVSDIENLLNSENDRDIIRYIYDELDVY